MTIKRTITQLLPVVAILVGSCKENKQVPPANATTVQPYNVVEVSPQSVTISTNYPATIQASELVEIRPKIEGYLEELFIDEGARVSKGQKLFRISSPEYEQALRSAEAGIKTAQAEVDAAQMTVNKTKPLVDKDIISAYELQAAQYTLQAKQAALLQAKATLANARANVGYTLITSPANGIISSLPYKKGSLVSGTSASALTTISVDKDVFAYFALNEKEILELSRNVTGNSLQEKLKQLPAVDLVLADGTVYSHKGKIETASGLLTTETGSTNLRATFPNPETLLRSGASAIVRVPRTINAAIIIPQNATYELQDKRMVYVVTNNNKVLSRAITTTPTNDGQFFIVNTGLNAGEKIVVNGIANLKDSLSIKVIPVDFKTIYNLNSKI
jgi:membrane fusion protein (multidrug efflux system)